jgi:ATP-dependent Lon protease
MASNSARPDVMPPIPSTLAILPVRGFVVFPRTMSPINVRRSASIQLLNETLPQNKIIGVLAQRDETKDEPTGRRTFIRSVRRPLVVKLLRQADDRVVIIVQALRRFAGPQDYANGALPARGNRITRYAARSDNERI